MGGFAETLMEHFNSPRNQGPMPDPDLIGHVGTPGRGPFFILYLRVHNNVVTGARFQCHGCGSTIASGSVLTELIAGRSVQDCLKLTVEDLINALDGIPAHKRHSPYLAIAAMGNAIGRHGMG